MKTPIMPFMALFSLWTSGGFILGVAIASGTDADLLMVVVANTFLWLGGWMCPSVAQQLREPPSHTPTV